MINIKEILSGIYDNPELRKTIVPLFMGDPGVGKSVQIKEFAKERGVKMIDFITSQRNPFEISGLGIPNRKTERMEFWDFDTLLDMNDGDILFFDEVFNGNPTVLNACLTLLESREMISGKKLPNIMIVAAANPQGMVPLTPQIKERFVWYKYDFNKEDWMKFMMNKYKMPKLVSSKLCNLISKEEFKSEKNYLSARSVDKAVNMIINNIKTPYEDELIPILETLITNNLKEAVKLTSDRSLEPGEHISWLEMIRMNNNIKITEIKEDVPAKVKNSENEILIFNNKNEVIGEVKNIEVLKSMYYFSDKDIENIKNGIKTPPSQTFPLPFSQRFIFFQKI